MSITYNEASNANGKRPNASESDEAPTAPIELPLYKSKYVRVMIGNKKYKMLPEKWETLNKTLREQDIPIFGPPIYTPEHHGSARSSSDQRPSVRLVDEHDDAIPE